MNAVNFSSHAMVLFSASMLSLVVFNTGGVNSPNIAWMPVIPVAALMLLGVRWSIIWLLLIVLLNLFHFAAVAFNVSSSLVSPENFSLEMGILSKLNVIFFLVLAIALYDWMRNAKLRDLAARNAELLQTHDALRAAQTHRDDFIAAVGHELRTPMNAILGLNSVLVSELAEEAEQAAIAVHIRKATEQLLRVVNDILDISQLEAGRLVLQSAGFSLKEALLACQSKFAPRANEKGLSLNLCLDPALPDFVEGDRARFEQVVNHLLDNAVKFTPQGSVDLRCLVSGDMVRIEVQDTGLGIDPAINQAIFNRFSLASEGVQRMYGGAGLGLSLSDRLISLLGGRMGLSSPDEGGTLFWFDLPLRAAKAAYGFDAPFVSESSFPLSVLVVDDTPVNLLVVEILLKNLWPHCIIHTADSGANALQACTSTAFALVLMDVVMPHMDGLETTRQLLSPSFSSLSHKPFVVGLTAHSLASETQACLAVGMDAVLFKPIDPSAVSLTLQKYLGKPSNER
ncbi:MAG: ATP-binding protein [Burkholderiaceae bacterium]|nr:ATP-binding protein [Burkholderiaceae bacterium]